jgi:hypothetical protein
MGVPREKIIHSAPGYHTRAEGDAFLDEARKRGWKRVVTIANPHQIVRATLGIVRTINDQSLPIAAYSDVPPHTNWDVRVKGSQGKERKPRRDHVKDEVERVF